MAARAVGEDRLVGGQQRYAMKAGGRHDDAVGGVGVVVHMSVLLTVNALLQAHEDRSQAFLIGQTTAAVVAMTFNYFVNNQLTYRDKRLKGLWANIKGLLSFYLVCAVGTVANTCSCCCTWSAWAWDTTARLRALCGSSHSAGPGRWMPCR